MVSSVIPTEKFTSKAEIYNRFRPKYKKECFTSIFNTFQVSDHSVVADVGSGTGISTKPLLHIGAKTFAVEPNIDMRKVAEKELTQFPNFFSVYGTAEKTTLDNSSIDIILVAQALHWFDLRKTRLEFNRILKNTGRIVILWNERRTTGSKFLEDLETFLQAYSNDSQYKRYQNVTSKRTQKSSSKIDSSIISDFFHKGIEGYRKYLEFQILHFDEFVGRITSYSYLPNPCDSNYDLFINDLKKLFKIHQINNTVRIEYDTHLFWGR